MQLTLNNRFVARLSIGVVLLLAGFPFIVHGDRTRDPHLIEKQILIIHSYRPYYRWTRNIQNGIEQTLRQQQQFVPIISLEYLGFPAKDRRTHLDLLSRLYKGKYEGNRFDVIIVSDNYAFDFVRDRGEELFPGVPVVFCGVNRFQPDMLIDKPGYTGVAEEIDIDTNIELIFKLRKNVRQFVIWSVVHKNADKNRESIASKVRALSPDTRIIHMRGQHLQEGLEQIGSLSNQDVLFLSSVIRDENGNTVEVGKTARLISKHSEAPLFSFWDFFLESGIVGGNLTSGSAQGRVAAELAISVITGTPVSNLPVVTSSPNQYMFDFEQLERFDIGLDQLPEDSVIFNKQLSFFEKY